MGENRLERKGAPTGLERLLFRAPIMLYRAGLGFLLGRRFLMLEHTGRRSGETRRTILEVVVNDSDSIYVVAGWGTAAQWLKNVRANPHVTIHVGSRSYRTRAEMVDGDEAHDVMRRYGSEHPRALNRLAALMLDEPGDGPREQADRVADRLPMVRFPKR